MKAFIQGSILLGFFVAANVVAAGVVFVLGATWQGLAPGSSSPWPWMLICGAAAIASLLFLRGAICYAPDIHALYRRYRGQAR